MKTLRALTIFVITATLVIGPVGYAQAANAVWAGANKKKTVMDSQPKSVFQNLPPGSVTCPGCNKKKAGNNNNHGHRHGHDNDFSWGAFAGGTLIGLAAASAANQPKQQTQPTVVVVQQPTDDAYQQSLEKKIEQERAKRIALEMELEELRAARY